MSYKILIAGAGQLGSRYLQGLACYPENLEIVVYDISELSLQVAAQRWKESGENQHEIFFTSNLADISLFIDLAIVASTADVRLELVQKINLHSNVNYWVLEKVLTQSVENNHKILRVLSDCDGVWVNTPRYLSPLYSSLKKLYPGTPPVCANFYGINGLACNSIHFIDLVARWSDVNVVRIDVDGLGEWYESKRSGFYEAFGSISVYFEDGSILNLHSRENEGSGLRAIFKVGEDIWRIYEEQGVAICSDGRRVEGIIGLQSEITSPLIKSILLFGTCNLPTLSQSVQSHDMFIQALLTHWNRLRGTQNRCIPIT